MSTTQMTVTLDEGDIITTGLRWRGWAEGISPQRYEVTMLLPQGMIVLRIPDDVATLAGAAEAFRHLADLLDAETVRTGNDVTTEATRESVLSALNEPTPGMEVHADTEEGT